MSGGPIFPSSRYFGGASGFLYPTYYISGAGTVVANSAMEGIGCVASLGSDQSAILQFNLPETVPTGVMKCRVLSWANASSGVLKLTLSDGQTAPGSNIANTTLTNDTQISQTWTAADVIVENKITLATVPVANNILTLKATFNASGFTLAAASVHQMSLIWE